MLPGIVAPGSLPKNGRYDVESLLQFVENNTNDLSAKKILEVGTWDGPLAFKLKSKGYDVVASDIQNPDKTGFNVTSQITGLDVPYVRCSVYDLQRHFDAEFDVVIFFGVFYHLKYPILAFERIAKILKPGGRILFMGSGVSHHFESLEGLPLASEQANLFRQTLDAMDAAGVPLCLSYPGNYLNGDNWFMPNRNALAGWIKSSGFTVGAIQGTPNDWGVLSLRGWAEKTSDRTIHEHGLVGETGGFLSEVEI
ncbi:hypothetical protein ICHIJ1_10760 [Fluviibacter phosphoraccumulans]|nr:hypothetical protein ICHIJ1_10760 [Fluviibacter phosphoraccumulans]